MKYGDSCKFSLKHIHWICEIYKKCGLKTSFAASWLPEVWVPHSIAPNRSSYTNLCPTQRGQFQTFETHLEDMFHPNFQTPFWLGLHWKIGVSENILAPIKTQWFIIIFPMNSPWKWPIDVGEIHDFQNRPLENCHGRAAQRQQPAQHLLLSKVLGHLAEPKKGDPESVVQWIGWRENLNRKPWFLPSNWSGFPVKFSHHPILWVVNCHLFGSSNTVDQPQKGGTTTMKTWRPWNFLEITSGLSPQPAPAPCLGRWTPRSSRDLRHLGYRYEIWQLEFIWKICWNFNINNI